MSNAQESQAICIKINRENFDFVSPRERWTSDFLCLKLSLALQVCFFIVTKIKSSSKFSCIVSTMASQLSPQWCPVL